MITNACGIIAREYWNKIPAHFANIQLDACIVMPNHIHGIISIVRARHAVPLRESFGKPVTASIPTIIRSFKSAVSKCINEYRRDPEIPVWQRNYYEHIIRADESLDTIREYIINNPRQWDDDELNPHRKTTGIIPALWRHGNRSRRDTQPIL